MRRGLEEKSRTIRLRFRTPWASFTEAPPNLNNCIALEIYAAKIVGRGLHHLSSKGIIQ
jgi:hypothetical protein